MPQFGDPLYLIVGLSETEEDFELLLDWLKEAQLDRVDVSNTPLLMARQRTRSLSRSLKISNKIDLTASCKLNNKLVLINYKNRIGTQMTVIIDEVDDEGAMDEPT